MLTTKVRTEITEFNVNWSFGGSNPPISASTKMKKGGYKEMLRDRCPRTVSAALIWCKAKQRWIDHVYDSFVRFLMYDKKAKDQQVRTLLGLSKNNRNMEFKDTINWEDLSKEEKEYWKAVSKWVNWFEKNIIVIAELYTHYYVTVRGKFSDDFVKNRIINTAFTNIDKSLHEKLYKYTIEHIKKYYV